jgi:ACR3 family arsenite efflux pump ArsB
MKLKSLDRGGVMLIFIFGGLFGFTDFNSPKDLGTFLGSAMVIMFLSLGIGWIINKILMTFKQYRNIAGKINKKISPIIIIGLIGSMAALISGIIEFVSY